MRRTIYPYIRFSSEEQRKGDSLRRQLSAIQEYALKNDFQVDETLELRDLGVSAAKGANLLPTSALGRFLRAIELGRIPTDGTSYLCVEQLDRLSRQDLPEAQSLFNKILTKNVNIITLMDNQIYTKESLRELMPLMYSLVVMQQAYLESEKKSERIKASFQGRLEKIKNGEKAKYASALPNWIDEKHPKSGIFELNKHANTVKRIFDMAVDNITLNQIAVILNQTNTPRMTRNSYANTNGVWSGSLISQLIKNKCTVGELEIKAYVPDPKRKTPKPVVVDRISNYYPAAIEEHIFILANEAVKERRVTGERGRSSLDNLFSSLMFCGDCLQRIHFETDEQILKNGLKKYKLLKCTGKRFGKECCAVTIQYQPFEDEFPKLEGLISSNKDQTEAKIRNATSRLQKAEASVIKLKETLELLNQELIETSLEKEKSDISYFVKTVKSLQNKLSTSEREVHEANLELYQATEQRKRPQLDLSSQENREAYKRQIKELVAGIVIYTQQEYAWVLLKSGGVISFRFGKKNKGNRMDDFLEFYNDIQNKIKSSEEIDPKFYKIIKSLTAYKDPTPDFS